MHGVATPQSRSAGGSREFDFRPASSTSISTDIDVENTLSSPLLNLPHLRSLSTSSPGDITHHERETAMLVHTKRTVNDESSHSHIHGHLRAPSSLFARFNLFIQRLWIQITSYCVQCFRKRSLGSSVSAPMYYALR